MGKVKLVPNSKQDWDKTMAEGFELLKKLTDAKEAYDEFVLKTFGVKDGQPLNLLQIANMIRQVK